MENPLTLEATNLNFFPPFSVNAPCLRDSVLNALEEPDQQGL